MDTNRHTGTQAHTHDGAFRFVLPMQIQCVRTATWMPAAAARPQQTDSPTPPTNGNKRQQKAALHVTAKPTPILRNNGLGATRDLSMVQACHRAPSLLVLLTLLSAHSTHTAMLCTPRSQQQSRPPRVPKGQLLCAYLGCHLFHGLLHALLLLPDVRHQPTQLLTSRHRLLLTLPGGGARHDTARHDAAGQSRAADVTRSQKHHT